MAKTLKSLLCQTMQADRTVLWIAKEDFSALPRDVLALRQFGLELRDCEDIRSYKKLLPALAQWPDAAVVTADDDVYYAPDWLERLVDTQHRAPGSIVAHRGHMALIGAGGRLLPYAQWEMATGECRDRADALLFPTGVGGIFYPPDCFDPRVSDAELALHLCPDADDVWFFWMAELRNAPHCTALAPIPDPIPWQGSQDIGLFHDNWLGSRNDCRVQAMQEFFGLLAER